MSKTLPCHGWVTSDNRILDADDDSHAAVAMVALEEEVAEAVYADFLESHEDEGEDSDAFTEWQEREEWSGRYVNRALSVAQGFGWIRYAIDPVTRRGVTRDELWMEMGERNKGRVRETMRRFFPQFSEARVHDYSGEWMCRP